MGYHRGGGSLGFALRQLPFAVLSLKGMWRQHRESLLRDG